MAIASDSELRAVLEATRPLWEDLRGERVLITGGTGFFGKWLLETFAHANRELGLKAQAVALSRHPSPTIDASISHVAADVRTVSTNEVPGHFEFVIHAATAASALAHRDDPVGTYNTIVAGTRRMLDLATPARTKRLLFLSSGAVYGRQSPDIERLTEGASTPPNHTHAYAEGKRAAEALCLEHARADFTPVIARAFAFAGPGMELGGPFAFGCFIRDALRGGPIRIEGDGTALRSYLYASDLATWLWTLLFRGHSRRFYHVGSEAAVSIAELAERVAKVVAPSAQVEVLGKASGEKPERYIPSTARTRAEFGLSETVDLDESIRRTADWARFQKP